jgi:GNAT superfamily N-acetyltransferase
VDLQRVSADDLSAVGTLTDIVNASLEAWEHPETRHRTAMSLRHGWDGEPGEHYLACAEGAPIGRVAVLTSSYDNLDFAWIWLSVLPGLRRRGLGTAALHAAYDVCLARGRTLVGFAGWDGPPIEGFAAAHGFERKSRAACRRLHLAELEDSFVDAIRGDAGSRASDYEVQRIAGPTPGELLPALSALTEVINDAPLDDLELEDEVFPVDRIRAYETAQLASGYRLRRLLARHRRSGELAGHTVVTVDAERPGIGHQHDTAVARDHRGHRLGLLLKAEMLRWLRDEEPELATIDTFNAESNAAMVGVNDVLGYRVLGREVQFQRRL